MSDISVAQALALAGANAAEAERQYARAEALTKEVERLRKIEWAAAALFVGKFIDAGAREASEWSQELDARLKPLRAALQPQDQEGGGT